MMSRASTTVLARPCARSGEIRDDPHVYCCGLVGCAINRRPHIIARERLMTTTAKRTFVSLGLRKPWRWGRTNATDVAEAHIVATDSPSDAARQIALEQLAMLHSIRRIL